MNAVAKLVPMGLAVTLMMWVLACSGDQGGGTRPATTPGARAGHSMADLDGDAYLFGGQAGTAARSRAGEVLNDLWRYDFEDNVWSPHAAQAPSDPVPAPRRNATLVTWAHQLWLFGGTDAAGQQLNDLWRYDPETNTWQQAVPSGDVPPTRSNTAAVVTGDQLVLASGLRNGDPIQDAWIYDFVQRRWSEIPNTPSVVWSLPDAGAALGLNQGEVLYYGTTGLVVRLDVATGTWTELNATGWEGVSPRRGAATAQTGDFAFLLGGDSGAGPLNEVWRLDLDALSWTRLADLPRPLSQAAVVAHVWSLLLYGGLGADSEPTSGQQTIEP